MHEDGAGIDSGAYGLRLRSIDMLKFGHLYLAGGEWRGRQIVPEEWVKASFTPWRIPKPRLMHPSHGWYWWQLDFGAHWRAHAAVGWRGQRIVVIPEQGVVVVRTAHLAAKASEDEHAYFLQLMHDYVIPTSESGRHAAPAAAPAAAAGQKRLADALARLQASPPRFDGIERRLIPSIAPKETHHALRPSGP